MKEERSQGVGCIAIAGLAATAFLVVCDVVWFGGLYRQWQSGTWSRIEGAIQDISIHEEGRLSGKTHTVGVLIKYSFEVNGKTYSSLRRRYNEPRWGLSPEKGREYVRDHPQGSAITVFYDSSNPSRSVLEPGLQAGDGVYLVAGVALNLAALGFWLLVGWWGFRRRRTST